MRPCYAPHLFPGPTERPGGDDAMPAGDNRMIYAAVETCAGHVLVVTTTSESTGGMFGSCQADRAVALVIDEGVRDIASLSELQFPAWARAIAGQETVKTTARSVNVPVICADSSVNPGDGPVVVPRTAAAKVALLGGQ